MTWTRTFDRLEHMAVSPFSHAEHCWSCGNPLRQSQNHQVSGFCVACTHKLSVLMQHIKPPSKATGNLILTDVEVRVNSYNRSGVIHVDGHDRPGWHKVISVEGPVKCLVCDGLTTDQAVCDDCSKAVAVIREIGARELVEIGKAIHNSGLAELANAVSKGLITKWIQDQMEEMEETSEQRPEGN